MKHSFKKTWIVLPILLALTFSAAGVAPARSAPAGSRTSQEQTAGLQEALPAPIDPLVYLEQKILASDGASYDSFGYSVAVSGNTALVGAYNDDVGGNSNRGSAYVFVRSGATWSEQAHLTASDGASNDYFGYSVALSGDTALVGAYQDQVGVNVKQGSVYVFVRSGTAWTQQAKLTASDGAAGDLFGSSVALSGDTALVGAYMDNASGAQGSAYVFTRSGTTWTQQAKLTASDGATSDYFGISVGLSSDTALVGAYKDDVGTRTDQGSAYVFVRSGTNWTQQAKLTASDGVTSAWFGYSASLAGDTALIGAYQDPVNGNANRGSAYVFVRSGTTWTQQAKLTASDGGSYDEFGYSVALSGDTALVGAHHDNVGGMGQGSAYVFARSGTTWTQQTKLTASDGAASDLFGDSVALSGDTALVGADGDDVGANSNQGSAYFYQTNHTAVYYSQAANDGWILESTETSNQGGTMNSTATTFNLGDDATDRQYRALLSFYTAPLPDTAVITKVTLRIKYQGVTGTSPLSTHGLLYVDIRSGAFGGNGALQLGDFQAVASKTAIGAIPNAPANGWYSKTWTSGIFAYINKAGLTQFRLRFATDDNNDSGADFLAFYSGNASAAANRPRLIVEYYVP